MKTFNKRTKQKYIDRAVTHREQDEIVQGLYWKDGKGCCVGCLAHANENAHEKLEDQTGVPVWLSRIADTIFEGLSDGEFQKWPERFMSAVPKNKTHEYLQEKVKAPFLIIVLERALETFNHEEFPDVKKAIDQSIELWRRDDIGSEDFLEAAGDAWAAAGAAARAAARAAAGAAARAAGAAGAAGAAKYKEFSDELVRIMEEAS